MSNNLELWEKLGKTDPAHTKRFKRSGGFEGTAIKPMFSYRRMTEEFGPCGEGWGLGTPSFQIVNGENKEILVFCTVSVWYVTNGTRHEVFGVGGDKIVTHIKANTQYNRPERWENDDEAFKKAFTDAVTNALKMIGVGADVHMGMFDDSKYVNAVKAEFSDDAAGGANVQEQPKKSSAALKRENSWEKLRDDLALDMVDVRTIVSFERVKADYRERARSEGWPAAWLNALKDEFASYEKHLVKPVEDDIQDQFPGSQIVNETHKEAAE